MSGFRTSDYWCRKQPLYQLPGHKILCYFQFTFTESLKLASRKKSANNCHLWKTIFSNATFLWDFVLLLHVAKLVQPEKSHLSYLNVLLLAFQKMAKHKHREVIFMANLKYETPTLGLLKICAISYFHLSCVSLWPSVGIQIKSSSAHIYIRIVTSLPPYLKVLHNVFVLKRLKTILCCFNKSLEKIIIWGQFHKLFSS